MEVSCFGTTNTKGWYSLYQSSVPFVPTVGTEGTLWKELGIDGAFVLLNTDQMNISKRVFLNILLLYCYMFAADAQVYITPQAEQRAKALVSQMTLEEKIDYISGPKSFYIRAVPRLGIPEIRMADGPQGIRNNTQSTLYPCGILSASTWNRRLVRDLGNGLGQDARARGVSILLGPGVNIYRSPLCGRNYE